MYEYVHVHVHTQPLHTYRKNATLPFRSLAVKLGISLPFGLVPAQDKAIDTETVYRYSTVY